MTPEEEDYAEVHRRIREAEETCATALNFNKLHSITKLPRELEHLTFLQTLDLSGCWRLCDLTPLAGLASLQTLDLSDCSRLRDLTPLSDLISLQMLDLSYCREISDFSVLARLTSLKALKLWYCEGLSDISPLAGLTSLHTVDLPRCEHLTDLSALAGLTCLQTLDLSGCEHLSDVSPLASLTSLQTLDLSHCKQLTDISSLTGLISLQTLDLSHCEQLSDISSLADLTSLRTLDLSHCDRLGDISPLAGRILLQITLDDYTWIFQQQQQNFSQQQQRSKHPSEDEPGSSDDRLINVLYATNRAYDVPVSMIHELLGFSSNRSLNLTYGSVMVRVPEKHKFGRVEDPEHWSPFGFIRREQGKERKYFTLKIVTKLTREEFTENVNNNKESSALLFVHGYNTNLKEAIFRLAQIAWDSQYRGVPVAFSWPSKSGPAKYDYDRESALFSRGAFLQVLELLCKDAKISKIYVVAHSMGSQIVVDALAHAQGLLGDFGLSEIVLAAPDIDRDVFECLIPQLVTKAKNITLYASAADKALLASQLKAQGPRAGYISFSGPFIFHGIETIDVTAVGDDMFALNHGAYSGSRSVIDDIGRLVLSGIHPPNLRSPQIRAVPEGSAKPDYWRYPH